MLRYIRYIRYFRPLALLAVIPMAAVVATAQGPMGRTPASDSLYQQAQRLVMNGNGADGRSIVDSIFRAAEPGSLEYAEALYWKAALADNAAEAERGYLQLTIEYPLSPRAEAALLRLGQLELTRGNRSAALSRFMRAAREFPNSPQRAHSWYTVGRIQLEDGRRREGCLAIRESQVSLPADDVELRNKVDYLARQCVGVALDAPADSGPAAGRRVAAGSVAPVPANRAPAPATPNRPPAAEKRPAPARQSSPPEPAVPVAPPLVRPPTTSPATPVAPTPPVEAVTQPRPATPPRRPAARRGAWSVQVAAFDRAEPAEGLAAKLRKDGFDARVDVDEKWHRVRVGYYPTRAAAADEARELKAHGVTGFVTGSGQP